MTRFILIGILLIIVARMFWRVIDGVIAGMSGGEPRQVRGKGKLVRDPVCGTFVAETSALTLTAGGTTRYFCSEQCREDFRSRQRR
jgi:YHS domain-containing protein